MEKPDSYCEYVSTLNEDDLHRVYHDTKYGFQVNSDDELFGRLILEINQAGLSWTTILKKQNNFRVAFSNFNIKKIANYKEKDIERLLANSGIIRNKLKTNAVIFNANKIIEIQKKYNSFKSWLNEQQSLDLESWVKLFKVNFKFTGGEITKEFLMSTGYVNGAHIKSCRINKRINNLKNQ